MTLTLVPMINATLRLAHASTLMIRVMKNALRPVSSPVTVMMATRARKTSVWTRPAPIHKKQAVSPRVAPPTMNAMDLSAWMVIAVAPTVTVPVWPAT